MYRHWFGFLFLIFALPAGAATYNIGPGQTYTTFAALAAAHTLTSDDIVDGGGNTFAEVWTINGSGTAGHVVTLRNAVVTGGIDGNSKNYLRITRIRTNGPIVLSGTNCEVDYSMSSYSIGNGITITGASNVVYNATIDGASGRGIDAEESCTVKNTIIRNTVDANLYVATGKTVTGSNNQFRDAAVVGAGAYSDAGSPWSALPATYVSASDWIRSAAWNSDNPAYRQDIMGYQYTATSSPVFSDSFPEADGPATNWTVKRGTFAVSSHVYTTTSASNSLTVPTTDYSSWKDFIYQAKVTRLGAPGEYGYAMIYFRIALSGSNDSGYAFLFRNNGSSDIYTRVNGGWGSQIAYCTGVPQDNNEHLITISAVGSAIKVWIDGDYTTDTPELSVTNSTYSAGMIGLGAGNWNGKFDDVSVKGCIGVSAAPKYIYTDGTATITLTAQPPADFTNLAITATRPNSSTFPLAASGSGTTRTATFPNSPAGIYKIYAATAYSQATIYLSVKQKPLYTFVQINDTHVGGSWGGAGANLTSVVSDINNEVYTPKPDFVVAMGDFSEDGTEAQLGQVKTALDALTIPYYPIIGAHDYKAEAGSERGHYWVNTFGSTYRDYSWTLGNFLFIAIDDGAEYFGYGTTVGSAGHRTFVSGLLSANPGKYVILFDHLVNAQTRTDGGAKDFWNNYDGNLMRATLESDSNVIANFGAHAHVNGSTVVNGILYQQTAALYNCDQYRYVELYADRIESFDLPVSTYDATLARAYWAGSTDSTHVASLYTLGLPQERQFVFRFADRILNNGNYRLLPVSPAINAGTDVGLTSDFDGKTVPIGSAPEIGAYEFQPRGGGLLLGVGW